MEVDFLISIVFDGCKDVLSLPTVVEGANMGFTVSLSAVDDGVVTSQFNGERYTVAGDVVSRYSVLELPRSAVLTTDIDDDVGSGRSRRLVCGQEDVSTMEDDFPAKTATKTGNTKRVSLTC